MEFTVILGMDMETDIGSWSSEQKGIREGTPYLLDLFERKDIPATFFWVGATAQENPDMVRATAQSNHEVGFHSLYHETVGDPLFPIPGVYPVLPEELENRLRKNKQIVWDAAGKEPTSFRAPRLFGGTHLVNTLEKMGVVSDASYPMYFYKERLQPYHPSADDWTQEGDLKIIEIPNFADLSIESNDPYGRDRDQWPLFRTEGAEALMVHVRNYLAYVAERKIENPVLCFYFHPWEFVEMPQGEIYSGEGYVRPDPFIVLNCGDYARRQFEKLLDELEKLGGQFSTCLECARRFA
ncbi:MAG: polysaccharide deacetylase family protein [Sphaerochaetaceae bacterium]|jgi:peptidoglycan/xylan/chitin deacetylase (PgdA/CDA1 family)|nr:polysaccharide deacetylase family protein [Sphaerochaetaceae bacterium]MDD4220241.1 polysaccharide deacetylase family protein [Sphaerochaetaceae bacterium]